LLRRVLDIAQAVSAKYLTLAVDERNIPALRLYRRWGFEPGLISAAFLATPAGRMANCT
jgi:ribosomal protein S18 acetylase RimI-like enzyme